MIVDVILTVLLIVLNVMTVYLITCMKALNKRVDELEQIVAIQQSVSQNTDKHHMAQRLREKFQ